MGKNATILMIYPMTLSYKFTPEYLCGRKKLFDGIGNNTNGLGQWAGASQKKIAYIGEVSHNPMLVVDVCS